MLYEPCSCSTVLAVSHVYSAMFCPSAQPDGPWQPCVAKRGCRHSFCDCTSTLQSYSTVQVVSQAACTAPLEPTTWWCKKGCRHSFCYWLPSSQRFWVTLQYCPDRMTHPSWHRFWVTFQCCQDRMTKTNLLVRKPFNLVHQTKKVLMCAARQTWMDCTVLLVSSINES